VAKRRGTTRQREKKASRQGDAGGRRNSVKDGPSRKQMSSSWGGKGEAVRAGVKFTEDAMEEEEELSERTTV